MKKNRANHIKVIIVLLAFTLSFTNTYSQSQQTDGSLRVTTKELKEMPVGKLVGAKTDLVVGSCTVTVPEGKDVKVYFVKGEDMPQELKNRLASATAGEIITVDRRIVIVDGKERRLPSLIYYIVN